MTSFKDNNHASSLTNDMSSSGGTEEFLDELSDSTWYGLKINLNKMKDKLDVKLRNLEQNCESIESALVSDKGQMICSSLSKSAKEIVISAIAAAFLLIGDWTGVELDVGMMRFTLIDGTEKSVIFKDISRIFLIGMPPSDSEIRLISFELNRMADGIQIAFES